MGRKDLTDWEQAPHALGEQSCIDALGKASSSLHEGGSTFSAVSGAASEGSVRLVLSRAACASADTRLCSCARRISSVRGYLAQMSSVADVRSFDRERT